MRKFSDWLHKISNGWLTLAGLIIFLLFTALVLPDQTARADEQPSETGTPDLSFYYTAEDLYRMAEAYGEAGRGEYIRVRFTFDLVWPLVYGFFLITSISWLSVRAFPAESRWQRANLAPVIGMLFDFLENLSTSLVMWRYPAQTPLVANLAGLFTMLKWVSIAASFVILVISIVIAAWRWITKRQKA